MSEPDKAMMGTAVPCPQAHKYDPLPGLVLVLIAASKATFTLAKSRNAMNTIRRHAADDAHLVCGKADDENLGDPPRVTVIATGWRCVRKAQQTPPLTVVKQPPQDTHEGFNTPSVWG